MIEVLDWIFQDAIHFFGVIVLMAVFFNGLTQIAKAFAGRNDDGDAETRQHQKTSGK